MDNFLVYVKFNGHWRHLGIYKGFSRDSAIQAAKADRNNSQYLNCTEWRATFQN